MNTLRRRLLLGLAVTGVALCGPVLRLVRRYEGSGSPDPATRLTRLIARRYSAAAVGRSYLVGAREPGEASAKDLVTAIAGDLGMDTMQLSAVRDQELRGLLASRIRADFEEENVVIVAGWMLSRTEARICALTALT